MRSPFITYIRQHPETDPATTAIMCTRCGTVQAAQAFYTARARRVYAETGALRGAITHCRDCQKGRNDARLAERYVIIRDAKAGGCADCGVVNLEHPEIFDFDHVSEGKVKTVNQRLTSGTIEDLRAEMARCEVVCSNCHRIRTRLRPPGGAGHDRRTQ